MKRGKDPLSSLSPIAIQVVVAGSETGTQAHETFAKERQFSTCRRSILDCLVCVLRLFEMLSSGAATGHAVARCAVATLHTFLAVMACALDEGRLD
jgi:hypothetical protein